MAKVKAILKQEFRYARDGINIDTIPEKSIIEGEAAEVALSLKIATKGKASDEAVYGDDGFVVEESEDVVETLDQAKQIIADQGLIIENQAGRIAELEAQVEELSKPQEKSKPDGDANAEAENTQA